jgi:hypothetical protein
MSTPFDGSWNDGTASINSQSELVTIEMPGSGRPSARGSAVTVGSPVIYADFTDDAPFTGVLSADGQKILWSNATVWTRDNGNGSALKVADETVGAAAPNAAAVQAVTAAIKADNPQVNGVNFGPFDAFVVPTAGNFVDIGDTGANTSVSFYQYQGTAPGPWLPLGDIVAVGGSPLPAGIMVFAPGSDPQAFANPTGFVQILVGMTGALQPLFYWRPVPPADYVAVGICFSTGDTPLVGNYWCVSEKYVQQVSAATAWSDAGAGWNANGDVLAPVFTPTAPELAPEGSILILPPTFLSAQDADGGNELPYALVGTQATLEVAPIVRPAPVYVDGVTAPGSTTTYGLGNVVVVPFTAVPGDAIPNQALRSPFYYVASEPFWACSQVLPTPSGGTMEMTEAIGLSQTNSTRFQQTTSMTVSCEFGAAYGGVSASVSASFTEEFQLETAQANTGTTENITTVSLTLPTQPITSIWEGQNAIQVFRADGTPVSTVTYSMSDLRFAPSGMTPARMALQAALARG